MSCNVDSFEAVAKRAHCDVISFLTVIMRAATRGRLLWGAKHFGITSSDLSYSAPKEYDITESPGRIAFIHPDGTLASAVRLTRWQDVPACSLGLIQASQYGGERLRSRPYEHFIHYECSI